MALTWKAASYLARASATEAVGGNMYQRWTATQRFQSSSEQTLTTESDDCHTCSNDRKHVKRRQGSNLPDQLHKHRSVQVSQRAA